MGRVIPFKPRKSRQDRIAEKLVGISEEIDAVILKHLNDDEVDPRDLVGVLSHRLGSLMNHIEGKSQLWDVCEKVLKKQAKLD